MGFFGRKKEPKKVKPAAEPSDNFGLGDSYEELFQKSLQMGLEFGASTVRCAKCGKEFTFDDGHELFRSMAKEDAARDTDFRNVVVCGSCFSIFACRNDYKNKKMVLGEDLTERRARIFRDKFL